NEGLPVLNSKLSTSVKMRESHEQSKPLIHLCPGHKLTQEYIALFNELYDREINPKAKTALGPRPVNRIAKG
ncbi:MAG: ParA family protein, partial [Pseudomonadota bacterium]|nr:ParA family protein [Pseudomonadota bacterium]